MQCFTCEKWCSSKWFRLVSLSQANYRKLSGLEMIFWIILKSSFLLAQIRNGLNYSKIVSTALYDSMTAYNWGFTSIIQLSTDQLFIFAPLWSLMLQCRVVICDQNSFVWNGIPLCMYHYKFNVHSHNRHSCPIDIVTYVGVHIQVFLSLTGTSCVCA